MTTAGNAETDLGSGTGLGCAAGCRTRRSVLAAVGAVGAAAALAGCETYGGQQPVVNDPIAEGTGGPAAEKTAPAGNGTALPDPPEDEGPPANALASLDDIPVGGGKIFADKGVVVTQPKKGTIKAFSATCTHAGCAVTEVKGGTINCNCHGSKFKVSDGSVKNGPANRPLAQVGVKVTGSSIVLT